MRLWAVGIVASALACTTAPAAADSGGDIASLQRLARGIAQEGAAIERGHPATAELHRAAQSRRSTELDMLARAAHALDPTAARKAGIVRRMLGDLEETDAAARANKPLSPRHAGPESPSRRLIESAASLGATCEHPLPLDAAHPISLQMDAAGSARASAWISVRTPAAGRVLVSSRGSDIDSRMALYRDCRDIATGPLAENDDSYNLAAEIGVDAAEAGQAFIARVDNLSAAGAAVLSVTTGATIRGRFTDAVTGAGIYYHQVVARDLAGQYIGQASSYNPDGTYELSLYGGGADARLRTYIYSETVRYVEKAYPSAPCRDADSQVFTDCTGTIATVHVADGGTANGIDFALDHGATLTAHVFDTATGAPIPSANVYLLPEGAAHSRVAEADANGRVTLYGIPSAQVRIAAAKDQYDGQVYSGLPCSNPYYAGDCPIASGTPIATPIDPVAHVDIGLKPQAFIDVVATYGGTFPSYYSTSLQVDVLNANGTAIASSYGNFGLRTRVGPLQPGTYFVRVSSSATFTRLYDGVDCEDNCISKLAQAAPVTISGPGQSAALATTLTPLPKVTGRVTEAGTGLPLAQVNVQLLLQGQSSYYYAPGATTDANGNYTVFAVPPGTYFTFAQAPRHQDQLYPGVKCESDTPLRDCAGGQTMTLGIGSGDRVVDFALPLNAQLSGAIRTLGGIYAIYPYPALFDTQGNGIAGIATSYDYAGHYAIYDIATSGAYVVGQSEYDYYTQLYRGVNCPSIQNYVGCNFQLATPVGVTAGASIDGIDFDMIPYGARVGIVTDQSTGQPIANVSIDLWSTTGAHLYSVTSRGDGRFAIGAGFGSAQTPVLAYVSTDNYQGYTDEVYDNIACTAGSAYLGRCSPASGAALSFPNTDGTAAPLQIWLFRDKLFGNDFE